MADKHVAWKHWRCTLERAEKFISPAYFSDINLYRRLYPEKCPVSSLLHLAAPGRITYSEAVKGSYVPVKVGDSFGPTWSTHWFQVLIDIPDGWAGQEVHLRWNSASEAMVWQDGKPMQGLTGADGHQQRTDFVLTTAASIPARYVLYIEMAVNGMFGAGNNGLINPPDPSRQYNLSMAEIAVFDPLCYQLLMDLQVIIDLAKHLPEDSTRAHEALYAANDIVNACREMTDTSAVFTRAHHMAEKFLNQKNGESQHHIYAVGNCHIDCAWLWPVAETVRKCGRSFATAVRLMEKYPDFKFVCSQAVQLDWVKEHYPTLFGEIKKFAKLGQFIPVGGTWVEMDGNIPSGESFIRQFLVGQQFYKAEFGSACKEFWLPDTFGYSAQLPQIMRGAGIKFFLTQKLSWSLINKFPHHTFFWEGIDGSRCLTHFPPADTYESRGDVKDVVKTAKNLKDKGRTHGSMLLYGHGDGGGGPSEDMIEMLRRMRDVDGCPRVKLSDSQEYFNAVEAADSQKLCTWIGELYLELHQGTFTTQAQIKSENRRGEFLLHDAEFMSAMSWAVGKKTPDCYPSSELLRIWKLFLLNQFHDILPGSCIREAVDDALCSYKEVKSSAQRLFVEGLNGVISQLCHNAGDMVFKPVVVNTLCWPRTEIVSISDELWRKMSDQERSSLQTQSSNTDGCKLAFISVPSMGISQLKGPDELAKPVSVTKDKISGRITLENSKVAVVLDCAGRVITCVHKASNRQAICPGRLANQFVLFDDIPLFWDAWDVMPYHLETRRVVADVSDVGAQILEEGPLRASVKCSLKISKDSCLTQVISLDAELPYVKFHCQVDWHENRKLLKVEFPVDVRAMNATYEIQFGHLERPTHCNTSWDWARYEVCAHKWADLSEHDWGVAVITDSKYGYSTLGNTMNVSLLRSPKAPDDQADMGTHEFSYALFPHSGTFQKAGLIQHAYNFNEGIHVSSASIVPGMQTTSFFAVDNPAVILETVKKAQELPSAVVVRLYECFGGHACTKLSSSLNVTNVQRCNMLEVLDEKSEVTWSRGVELNFKPFQVITLVLYID